MSDADSYWAPVCAIRAELGCWVRWAWRADGATTISPWGTLLLMPVEGYLEGPQGPVAFRDVEWVDLSTLVPHGGVVAHPLRMRDIKPELLARLGDTRAEWELRDTTWSIDRLFAHEPVQVVRIANPFGPKSQPARAS